MDWDRTRRDRVARREVGVTCWRHTLVGPALVQRLDRDRVHALAHITAAA